jgi:hypothetical protein
LLAFFCVLSAQELSPFIPFLAPAQCLEQDTKGGSAQGKSAVMVAAAQAPKLAASIPFVRMETQDARGQRQVLTQIETGRS